MENLEYIIKSQNLVKKFGTRFALDNTDFEIGKNRIVGLMGPNGSGKTTLMKIMAGLLRHDSGNIEINGFTPGVETKSIVSFMPDCNFLYKWMTVGDAVRFFSDMFPDYDMNKSQELLEFMKLKTHEKTGSLSKGMLERLLLVLTLSRKAKLYILDEPLGGIDPVAKNKITDVILEYFNGGGSESTIIISTHLIKDVERLFDDVIFLKEGKVTLSGNCDTLRQKHGKSIEELYLEVFDVD